MKSGLVRKILKIFWLFTLAVIVLLASALLLLQTTAVQTYLAEKVTEALSGEAIDARITFGKLHLKPFNTLVIRDLVVTDPYPASLGEETASDTLFTSEYIAARFTLKGLTDKCLSINSAFVRNARMNLVLEDGEHSTNLTRMFRIPEGQRRNVLADKEIFQIKDVEVDSIRFTMKNLSARRPHIKPGGIDWNNLDIKDIKVKGRHLKLRGKVMSGELDQLSFTEKSGYSVRSISGRTSSGAGVAMIEDFRLIDNWSSIDIPYFCMLYDSAADFQDFIHKVRLESVVRPSRASMKTIGYFAPGLADKSSVFDVNGEVYGTVSALEVDGMDISTEGGEITGEISGTLTGLPDIRKMQASIKMDSLSFSTSSIEGIMGKWAASGIPEIGKFASGTKLCLTGRLYGRADDMRLDGEISSDIGKIRTGLRIGGLVSKDGGISISGKVGTDNLELDRIMDRIPVRYCSMEAGLKAHIVPGGKDASLTIDSLKISRLNFMDYDYSGIAAAGTLSGHQFNGKVICNDPNLNFMFQGIFSLSGKTRNSLYRFYANIGYADLHAMNLDKRGKSRVSLQTTADFTSTPHGEVLGDVNIADITLENSEGRYDIGDIRISSFTGSGRYRIRLTSAFAEGSYIGSAPLNSFAKDLAGITLKKELPAIAADSLYRWGNANYELSFKTHDTMDLLAFCVPGLYIADGTSLKADIDRSGTFNAKLVSQRIAFNEHYIKDVDFEASNAYDAITGEIRGESVYLATIMMKNSSFKILVNDNHIGVEYSYDNQDLLGNRGEFVAVGDIGRNDTGLPVYDIRLLPSSVYLNSRQWNIYPSDIHIEGKEIMVNQVEFRSGEQSIFASGAISDSRRDTLEINMDRFDISVLNPLIGEHFGIEGMASGMARITSPAKDRGVLLDFQCSSTKIGGEQLGNLAINSGWDSGYKRFDISVANDLDGKRNLDLHGTYTPLSKELDFNADLTDLDLGYFQPFLKSIFSDIGGHVSGHFSINGPADRLSLESTGARLDDAKLRIAYTNVEYTATGPFRADSFGVYLDNVRLSDRHGNTGKITGKIGYDHFRNMHFDVGIEVNRMEVIDLDEGDMFYGHLFATGKLSVTGPLNSIVLSADASTAREGNLHIPIPSSLNAGSNDLLKFKETEITQEIDPYEQMMSRIKRQKEMSEEFELKLRVSTTPEVAAYVEIDKASGNILQGRGTGTIELAIRPSDKNFSILGDYTLTSGNYHFVALGIAARDFQINDGSTIRFNGDIMESTLNIGAVYRTKASLSTLIADTTSVNNRRTVECGVQITEKLSNPRLAFSIDIPDIDPMIKARVESALSTEDKVQRQFLSLLISNSFIPDEQSGIANNNSSVLFSNVTDIMTNQLNNIFQKLNIPLDLGLSYQQNNKGNDVFDVAVSTQLFNNRVIVNGNIGNRQYSTSGNSNSDVVGDIDIEIKLDRPGAFRLNLFSHSADQYTNYLDNSQRNGVGITYQQEFNHLGQFFKRLFMKKEKREAAELEEVMNAMNEEKVKIRIGEGNSQPSRKERRKNK